MKVGQGQPPTTVIVMWFMTDEDYYNAVELEEVIEEKYPKYHITRGMLSQAFHKLYKLGKLHKVGEGDAVFFGTKKAIDGVKKQWRIK